MTFTCDKCGSRLRIDHPSAKGHVRCPRCKTLLRVKIPSRSFEQSSGKDAVGSYPLQETSPRTVVEGEATKGPAAGTIPRRQIVRQVLGGFDAKIPKVRIGLGYRVAALLVMVAMVLLPVVYLALIGLLGYWVYRHAGSAPTVFENMGHGRVAALYYGAPLVAGTIAAFFMLKPLCAPRPRPARARMLDYESQSVVYGFVDRVAQAVGAPTPRRISVNCSANASAALGTGVKSLLVRDLTLTIGLPLVAGLSAQQLAGIIAHELGHFSQGAGMRMTYVVLRISAWFERVTFERDSWDEWLREWIDSPDRFGVFLIAWLAGLCVFISRCILWLLMTAGHLLSCLLLRQMEFHADLHEIRLVGSECFQSTERRMLLLGWAEAMAYQHAGSCWIEGRQLPDDLPALIALYASTVTKEQVRAIRRHTRKLKTGVFSTHPSPQERIDRAEAAQAEGVFHSDLPAVVLFRDFEKLSHLSTRDFYRSVFRS